MTEAELTAALSAFSKETQDVIMAKVLQYYFNDGVPYISTDQVLSIIDDSDRWRYMTVNILGEEYWFAPDIFTLVQKNSSSTIEAGSITLDKLLSVATGSVLFRDASGNGPLQLKTLTQLATALGVVAQTTINTALALKVDKIPGFSLVSNTEIAKIHSKFAPDEAAVIGAITLAISNILRTDNNYSDEDKSKVDSISGGPYTIILPADTTVAGRCLIPTLIPTGWSIAAGTNPNDLIVTHNLARRIVSVTVYSVEGIIEKQLYNNSAYSGIIAETQSILKIQGLATIASPIVIHLIFS